MVGPPDLRCPLCQGDAFEPGPTGEWALALPAFGRAKRRSATVICRQCHYVLTFAEPA